jgi:hypothetical protein
VRVDLNREGRVDNAFTGEFEYLLCDWCENDLLNETYEKPINKLFDSGCFNPRDIPIGDYLEIPLGKEAIEIMRRYLLAILWKASRSGRQFFGQIKLDEHLDGLIRFALMHPDFELEPDRIPILMVSLEDDDGWIPDTIPNPLQTTSDGVETAVFIISGFAYIFMLHECEGIGGSSNFIGFNENLRIRRMHLRDFGAIGESIANARQVRDDSPRGVGVPREER